MEDVAAGCVAQRVLEDLLYLEVRRGTQVAQGRGLQNLHSWVRIPPAPPIFRGPARTHRLHFWAKRVFKRLQSFFLQIDVAKIVIHKADQPNTFFHFFDTNSLTSEDRAEVDFFAVQTDTSAAGDVDGFVVERIVQFR